MDCAAHTHTVHVNSRVKLLTLNISISKVLLDLHIGIIYSCDREPGQGPEHTYLDLHTIWDIYLIFMVLLASPPKIHV